MYSSALESWTFVNLSGKTPLFTSPFGDIFLRDAAGIWFLDTVAGELINPWATEHDLKIELNTPVGQDNYLMIGLADEASATGLEPSPSQVYSFRIPPILGGAVSLENVEVSDFVVNINLVGQIHAQTRHLPPGTTIGSVTID